MSTFKATVLGFFSLAALIGIAVFALGGIGGGGASLGKVDVWGTLDEGKVSEWLEKTSKSDNVNLDLQEMVQYKELDKGNYEQEIVESLATGEGPDLFFLPQNKIVSLRNKVKTIPFESYSERKFKDNFVEEGELYLGTKGIYGLPVMVDPIVMYWNRNTFSSAGIAQPPENWKKVNDLAERLSRTENGSNIVKSAVALGNYSNIAHAKEILSSIMIQAGSPIVKMTKNGQYVAALEEQTEAAPNTIPAVTALRFYTQFSDPTKSFYSWNPSLDEARKEFLAGDLAMYFGFASELEGIRRANPNLNFDVAQFPRRGQNSAATFGRMNSLAISRNADNVKGAFRVANVLSGRAGTDVLAQILNLPPVRRGLLSETPKEAYKSVFYKAALRADAWPDPDPSRTEEIFSAMVDTVISGKSGFAEAVSRADSQLRSILAQ